MDKDLRRVVAEISEYEDNVIIDIFDARDNEHISTLESKTRMNALKKLDRRAEQRDWDVISVS